MQLSISRDRISQGLQAVQNVVSTRSTLPILANVLMLAEDAKLELTATDLDVTISSVVDAEVKKGGATTVPVKKLAGIVRALSGSELDIEVDEKNQCALRCGPSFYKILGLPAEEFPPVQKLKDDKKLVLPQKTLKTMLQKTAYAVSSDEARYVLNGIFFSLKEHKLTFVATDGRRLALVEEDADISEAKQGEFIVPAKTVGELERLLEEKGEVELRFTENMASFSLRSENGPATTVLTKLVEGNYPNYRQVIPREAKHRVALVREEFLQALRRAEIMTSEKSNSVKLAFTNDNLTISANSPDVGEARETLAVNYKGEDLSIAFNPRYLIEPLAALSDDEVYFELIDELSPGVLKVKSAFLYVVMPMRLA